MPNLAEKLERAAAGFFEEAHALAWLARERV